MRKFFYLKLAATNLRKNAKTYVPYLLTCVLMVMMYYVLSAISGNRGLSAIPGSASLRMILNFSSGITGVFSAIFLFYTNSFLIRQRKKEMGIYQVLGMDKRNLTKMMIWETLLTAAAGIGIGLAAGIVFGKLMFLILLKLIKFDVQFQFSVEPVYMGHTVILFGAVFLVMLLWNLFQVQRVNPVELLSGGKQGEKEPKAKWLLALIGFGLLGAGYYIAQTTDSPLAAIMLFFVAVLLVIFGTYAVMIAGSVVILKLLKKNKKFYYKTKHFTAVSGLIYRMKQNAVGIANICIMSTVVIVLISVTFSLYAGMEDIMNTRFQREFSVFQTGAEPENIAKAEQIVEEELEKNGVEKENVREYRYGALAALKDGNGYQFDGNGVDAYDDSLDTREIYLIPLEDYNALEGQDISLSGNEVLVYDQDNEFHEEEIRLGDETYPVKAILKEISLKNSDISYVVKSVYVIVPGIDEVSALLQKYAPEMLREVKYSYEFDLTGEKAACTAAMEAMSARMAAEVPESSVEYREAFAQEFYALYGGFLFLGIFVGALFLIVTVLIIYYKQISEGYDDRERFQIMQKVGMSKKEVRSSIKSQVLIVFFLPLLLAVIHVAFAFKVMTQLLAVLNLLNVHLFLMCTIGVVVVFAVFYTVVFAITSREYYKIVE